MSFKKTALPILACLISTTACADILDINAANNQIGAQIQSRHVDYTETANGSILDTESGHVTGYGLSASVMKDLWLGHDYLDAQYSRFSGQTDYIGAPFGGGKYGSLTGKSGAEIADFSLRYGKGFAIHDQFMVTPYAEFGYHRWDRDVGYTEHYTHRYYGIGALGQYSPAGKLVVSANAMIGHTYASKINVVAPFGFSAGLGNSVMYRAGISLDYAFTKNVHANAGIDYTSWEYGASAVQPSGYYEPDSRTKGTTIKAGMGYAF
ncbi:hypothetical protein TPL01_21530 [Sulfuriferula plumbiphila]|uniref:Outer membrane protein beta-barrel domain-containing protein n=1 Tax=Sulfuriferula plumbiphila TaxID=171865 RepID=A0A512L944_9PROT|nr:autotransporter outer membrane beta-barrel domain-containing protein [Sulfuriferula plumbiphila]BBP04368.1 hypothetical protein SFPGR_17900 [Sulfuriferula plumbiphila]GEP31015.1 hypothetical protein TPL01_21530 [Sulfuriferula plumbiphila]